MTDASASEEEKEVSDQTKSEVEHHTSESEDNMTDGEEEVSRIMRKRNSSDNHQNLGGREEEGCINFQQ